jgi:hypothetical protein
VLEEYYEDATSLETVRPFVSRPARPVPLSMPS